MIEPGRARVLVLALIAALFALFVAYVGGEIIDDAYIAYRYARNLAHGHGLVFNPGERVEGFTSASWVMLSALAVALGVSPVAVTVAAGAVSAIALALLAARWRRQLDGDRAGPASGIVALGLLVASADLAHHATSGLESTFFALAFDAALVALVRRRAVPFALLSAVAFLTRPEAGLLGLAGVPLLAFGPRDDDAPRATRLRDAARATAILAACVVPFVAWKWSYYGALLPNTLRAKTPSVAAGLRYVADALTPAAGVVAVALAGLVLARPRRAEIELFTAWAGIHVAAIFEGGDWMAGRRLLLHGLVPLALVFERGAREIVARFAARAAIARAVVTAAALPLLLRSVTDAEGYNFRSEFWRVVERDRVAAVDAMTKSGVRSIASFDVGLLGWAAPDAVILDLGGLTDRTLASTPGGYYDKIPPLEYLESRAPDAFLFTSNIPPVIEPEHGRVMIPSGYPAEDHVKGADWFRRRYAYRHTFELGGMRSQFLHWFGAGPPPPRPKGRDASAP